MQHRSHKALIISTNEYMFLLVVVVIQLITRCKSRLVSTEEDARQALENETFDFVICDFENDPELSDAAADHVRNAQPYTPLILFTNSTKQPFSQVPKTVNSHFIERLDLRKLIEVLKSLRIAKGEAKRVGQF